jgi:hypothetical protein
LPEKDRHKLWKKVACGCEDSRVKYSLPSGRRIDCLNDKMQTCAEVELNKSKISIAKQRLTEAYQTGKCSNPRLVVRDKDVAYAKTLVPNYIQVIPDSKLNEELLRCKINYD